MPAQKTATVKRLHSPSSYDPLGALLEAQPVVGEVAIDPGSISAGAVGATEVDITAAVPAGFIAATADNVGVYPPALLEAGLVAVSAHITADNKLTVRLLNTTSGAVNGAELMWAFRIERAPRFSYV